MALHATTIALTLWLGVTLICAQTPAPAAAPATIRGHVVAADTGQPLRKARVRLTQNEPIAPGARVFREPRSAPTDMDGAFEFTDVAPGRYTLSASKAAYVDQTWAPSQSSEPFKPLEVRAGQLLDRVDFSLQRGGVITGRVVDEFGEPLSNLHVAAMQARINNGKRDLSEMNGATTDDLGEFRMFGLTPGQYYVKAVWRRAGFSVEPAPPDRTGYPETYFPGTINVDDAQRLTVRAGQTIEGLAMALSPVGTARVEGTVTDVNGKPFAAVGLMAMRTDGNSGTTMGAQVRPDGTFVIASLIPGDYILRALPSPPRKEMATLKLTVGTEDIKDLRLVAVPPSIITGRVIVDPAQAQSLPKPLMLAAMPDDGQFFANWQPDRVADDFTFEIQAQAGRHRINWMNLAPGWIIRTIRINNVDVTDDAFEVKPGENLSGIDVELSNRSSAIAGAVSGAGGGDAAKDSTVILFPADSKRWRPNSRYMRIAKTDAEGRFKLTGLAPASYSIVAVEKLDTPGQWTDPEFLQKVSVRATTVTVMEGETRTIDLRVATGY